MAETAEKTSFTFSLESIYEQLLDANYSLGIFKMPDSKIVSLVADEFPTKIDFGDIDLETIKGFLVSPFENNTQHPTFLIKPSFEASFQLLDNGQLILESELEFDFFKQNSLKKINSNTTQKASFKEVSKSEFESNVEVAVKAIEDGLIKKVVLARNKEVELPKDFDLIKYFIKLCKEYPSSFVSLISSPISGVWIGASPELLVSLSKNSIFKTVSLAGTKTVDNNCTTAKTLWTEKEIEEQALVSRYIIDCFKKIRLREYEEIGPKTVNAGNLVHLKTEFLVNLQEVNFENLGTVMLNLLHPTSAVCGTPKSEALEFIHLLEQKPRAYYSGFLGPVNLNTNTDYHTSLFVNLRCMQLWDTRALLFAGAGITNDSVAEQEFFEIENKFMTLLNKLSY